MNKGKNRKPQFSFIKLSILINLLLLSCTGSRETRVEQPYEKEFSSSYRFEFKKLENNHKIELYIDKKYFTSYLYDEKLKKPILYPILTASGKTVTRGWPLEPRPYEKTDHPHHVGLWLNHGDVNGLDFWNNSDSIPSSQVPHYGTIYHQSIELIKPGDEKGILKVAATWQRNDRRILLEESTTYTFRGDSNTRIIDRLTALTAKELSVQFRDSKEGMMAIRVARELELPNSEPEIYLDENLRPIPVPRRFTNNINGNYRNSEGLEGDAVWGKRARWVILYSNIKGEPVSIIIMDHPENPNHPAHWMARGYGLFGVNPFGSMAYSEGRESLNFFIPAAGSVSLKYRIIIRNGTMISDEEIESMYAAFISNTKS